jgi:dTDP-4-amino-4,6-dideoxygalactose transaminase
MPLHLHPYYQELGSKPGDCPCAAALYPQLISLPLFPDLTVEEVERVCRTLKEILAKSNVEVPGASLAIQ